MIRTYTALLLVLMLVLSGQSMALMRAAPGMGGEIELCTGAGPVTITLDAEGNPTGPPHICPDCMAALGLAVLPGLDLLPLPDQGRTVRHALTARSQGTRAPLPPQARGPPRTA